MLQSPAAVQNIGGSTMFNDMPINNSVEIDTDWLQPLTDDPQATAHVA
jgi:hypothetical protein